MAKILTKKLFLRHTLHWAGSALALLGITFVALRMRDYGAALDFSRFDTVRWSAVVGLSLLYSIANLMLALAWWNLLKQLGTDISRRWTIKTYGVTQLAKYAPGNIFHLAGRQAIGMAAGVAGWTLAKSSVWELALISIAGAMFGLLSLPLLISNLPIAISAILFAAIVVTAASMFWLFVGPPVAHAFIWQVGFLVISGLIFTGLLALQDGTLNLSTFKWLPLCGAYVVAWLAGLVVPGAPAGVGIRELILLFLLKGEIAEADLVFIILVGRMVTVFGDFLFFLSSSIMSNTKISKM